MNELWSTILEDYETAKFALWGRKHCGHWSRDEDTGYYHMWKAYYAAINAEEKEHLVFARILMMMGNELIKERSDYTCLHKYYLPAKEQYQLAIESGLDPTEEELENMRLSTERLSYQFECEDKPYEEQLAYIEGYELLNDFEFHDSKVLFFSHDDNCAVLKLKNSKILELHFEEVDYIETRTDPVYDWIGDFYCYPAFYDKSRLIFDIDYYKITCAKIVVASYE